MEGGNRHLSTDEIRILAENEDEEFSLQEIGQYLDNSELLTIESQLAADDVEIQENDEVGSESSDNIIARYGTPDGFGKHDSDYIACSEEEDDSSDQEFDFFKNEDDDSIVFIETEEVSGTKSLKGSLVVKKTLKNPAGRIKDPIWNLFETKLEGKKTVSNICKSCKIDVSAKADRMRNHVNSCCKKQITTKIKSDSLPGSKITAPVSANAPVSVDVRSFLHEKTSNNNVKRTQIGMDGFFKTIGNKAGEEIDKALGTFLFSTNISFNVLENKEFKDFVRVLNPAYRVPSHDKIGSTVLEAVYKDVRDVMESQLKGTSGVLLQDGWSSNQNDSVIAHCLRAEGNTHLISTSIPSVEKAGAEYCFQEIVKAVEEAKKEFDCDVVGVVTDNCNTMVALKSKIKSNYPEMETIGCNPHLFNLLGNHFTPNSLKTDINNVQTFFKAHHFTVAALKKKKAKMPVLPGTTRWNSQIDSFLNYKENHADYLNIAREMKHRDLDKKTIEKLDNILKILNDSDIYDKIGLSVKILEPICRALDATQQNTATIADAVHHWINLDNVLPQSISENVYYKKQRKVGMIGVSIAAYLLHPVYKGENLKDVDKNLGITWISEKNNYYIRFCGELKKKQSDYFFDSFLTSSVQASMKPLDWWKQSVTSAVPVGFLKVVEILFLLPAGSSGIERCFSTMGNIMTKQRNRLSIEKATKLCCINGFFKIMNEEENRKNSINRPCRKRKFENLD